jgi:protein phosphatase 1H
MDQMVEQQAQKGGGGCTSLTVLFLNGKLYAAGAGDSRFDQFSYLNNNV